jgi:hypothetical protein
VNSPTGRKRRAERLWIKTSDSERALTEGHGWRHAGSCCGSSITVCHRQDRPAFLRVKRSANVRDPPNGPRELPGNVGDPTFQTVSVSVASQSQRVAGEQTADGFCSNTGGGKCADVGMNTEEYRLPILLKRGIRQGKRRKTKRANLCGREGSNVKARRPQTLSAAGSMEKTRHLTGASRGSRENPRQGWRDCVRHVGPRNCPHRPAGPSDETSSPDFISLLMSFLCYLCLLLLNAFGLPAFSTCAEHLVSAEFDPSRQISSFAPQTQRTFASPRDRHDRNQSPFQTHERHNRAKANNPYCPIYRKDPLRSAVGRIPVPTGFASTSPPSAGSNHP